jgi:hypothetical protein
MNPSWLEHLPMLPRVDSPAAIRMLESKSMVIIDLSDTAFRLDRCDVDALVCVYLL